MPRAALTEHALHFFKIRLLYRAGTPFVCVSDPATFLGEGLVGEASALRPRPFRAHHDEGFILGSRGRQV